MNVRQLSPIQMAGAVVVALGGLAFVLGVGALFLYPASEGAPLHPAFLFFVCGWPLALAVGLWVFLLADERRKVICPNCGDTNAPFRMTCQSCGTALPWSETSAAPGSAPVLTTVACPLCGQQNPADDSACQNCGTSLPKKRLCPRCGTPTFTNYVRCGNCQAPLWGQP